MINVVHNKFEQMIAKESKGKREKIQTSRIYPNWDEIKKLKTPLTEGELTLTRYLDNNLPESWGIYVQPFMNGDRPDIVILNENVGIMIIEVKDWNKTNYSSKREKKIRGKTHYKTSYHVSDGRGTYRIASPVEQVKRYRKKLISLYVPEMGETIDRNSKTFVTTMVGIYMHGMNTNDAKQLLKDNKYCNVFGSDKLDTPDNIEAIVPCCKRENSYYFETGWYDKIKFWLKPPYHSIEQGTSIHLSHEQKRHIDPAPHNHQRLRGVAGSGKSLVVAQRAANLAAQGKKVLVVSYNITLWHYLRDMISRVRVGFEWSQIEFTHFHIFCKDFLNENGLPWPDHKFSENDWLEQIPQMVMAVKNIGTNDKRRQYDAILIDEGQDYHKSWYDTLCMFLSDNDEMLFVIDEKQNIYKRNNLWVDKMTETKFRGRWRLLSKSYRMPYSIAVKAKAFSDLFLPNTGTNLIPDGATIDIFEPILIWKNLDITENYIPHIDGLFSWLTKKREQHPSDIVILVPTHAQGLQLIGHFQNKNIDVNHVFDGGVLKNKKSFYMGDSRLKISTIHSFKGWELKNIILLVPCDNSPSESLDQLIYTSITRSMSSILVLNQNQRYSEFGRSWN